MGNVLVFLIFFMHFSCVTNVSHYGYVCYMPVSNIYIRNMYICSSICDTPDTIYNNKKISLFNKQIKLTDRMCAC